MNISDLVPWRERRSIQRRNGGDSMYPIRREMDRLFEEFFRGWDPELFRGEERGAFNPALNVAESDDTIETRDCTKAGQAHLRESGLEYFSIAVK